MDKVHLGCGKRCLPGYVHVDLSPYAHVDYVHDIRTLPMFADSSIETIYASHTLEYFSREETTSVLAEWWRVLCLGGTLRLAVPDFEALLYVYSKTKDISKILGPIYGIWQVDKTTTVQHNIGYDFKSISDILIKNGFGDVRRWDWREFFVGELAGFDDYSQAYIPHMDKESGTLISLNVIATKI